MAPRKNPLKLNKLQLRTLALVQELARDPGSATADPESGDVTLSHLPHAHGDHMHIGAFVVSTRDASGFSNPAVWAALERKGLVRPGYPASVTLTAEGVVYDTGLSERFAQVSDH